MGDAKKDGLRPTYAAEDALKHTDLASSILGHVEALPLGSVVAVQGSWGSGKTDVVARIFDAAAARMPEWPEPMWLNPWKYGTPDLITPLVLEILTRIPSKQRRGNLLLRDAAKTLLRAGNAMLFKAVSTAVPFGSIVGAGEQAVDDFLKALFVDEQAGKRPDVDPLAAMADRFRELVAEYVRLVGEDGRLIICVDDLDRCLPDHQIAMLEGIHFLTSARAPCSFVVALDPLLVRQAAETHYRTAGFDSSRYLDKLFDVRIHLPALGPSRIGPLVRGFSDGDQTDGQVSLAAASIAAALDVDVEQLVHEFGETFHLPELANPRLILRVLVRLRLLALALERGQDKRLAGESRLRPVLVWAAITERWPQVRETLQASPKDAWKANTELMCWYYRISDVADSESEREQLDDALESHANVTARLPTREQAPDLGDFLFTNLLRGDDDLFGSLHHCDQVFGQYGV